MSAWDHGQPVLVGPVEGGLALGDLKGPFQTRPAYDSVCGVAEAGSWGGGYLILPISPGLGLSSVIWAHFLSTGDLKLCCPRGIVLHMCEQWVNGCSPHVEATPVLAWKLLGFVPLWQSDSETQACVGWVGDCNAFILYFIEIIVLTHLAFYILLM